MDEVKNTGDEIVITKNGKPVSKLVPYHVNATTLLGLHKDKISRLDKDIFLSGEMWETDTRYSLLDTDAIRQLHKQPHGCIIPCLPGVTSTYQKDNRRKSYE